LRFEAQRLTESVGFWLGIVIVVNLLLVGFFFDPSSAAQDKDEVQQRPLEPQLRLLVELSAAERLELARRRQVATVLPPVPPVPVQKAAALVQKLEEVAVQQPPVCRIWGPYNDEPALAELRRQIADVAENLQVQASEIQGSPDYLVYVDTQGNIDTARRMQQELSSQNFEAYLMSGGPFANALSVGVFSQRARAESQRGKVAGLGYQVAIEALPRSQEVYHLLAQVPADFVPDITPELAPAIAPASDCAAIASAG
jgi:hypothetical protein